MSSLSSNVDIVTGIFKQLIEQVAKDRLQLEEERKKFDEEKKAKVNSKSISHGQVVDLNVGGTRYSTSRSTLTKYPESMLGVMFSGRHDLETMKCSDGSSFIDRDGARFKYILDYLRDGEKVVKSFPKSADVVLGLFHDAEYYQLEGLITALHPLVRDVDDVCHKDIAVHFKAALYANSHNADEGSYESPIRFTVRFNSIQPIHTSTSV